MAGRRIGGAGGGSEKGKRGRAALVVGVVVVIGAGGVSATVSASTTSGSANSSAGSRGKVRVSTADSQAAELRLAKQGVHIVAKATSDAADCVAHSHGQMQDFFRRQPCVALHRALFEIRDAKGDVVLLAVAWVQMPDEASARELKSRLDTGGTGNITELSRDKGKYRSVRFTGVPYASRLDGTVVTNAQAQPVLRGPAGLALTSLVTNAVG